MLTKTEKDILSAEGAVAFLEEGLRKIQVDLEYYVTQINLNNSPKLAGAYSLSAEKLRRDQFTVTRLLGEARNKLQDAKLRHMYRVA
ncbi:hypothetical protein SEA_ZOOMAN_279 [Microbacterium phage Zooman]|nr:hypothetical protein SEA_ZOOMAN_279 [Microbacterium phage Zooman]